MFPNSDFTLVFNNQKYQQTIDGQNRMWIGKIEGFQIEPDLIIEIMRIDDTTFLMSKQ